MEVPSASTPVTSLPRPSSTDLRDVRDLALLLGDREGFLAFTGVRFRLPVALARGFAVLDCFAFCTVATISPLPTWSTSS